VKYDNCMARNLSSVKPQDALILLKLLVSHADSSKQLELALALDLSVGEISYGIQRLKAAKLLNEKGDLLRSNILEYLTHALKYLAPASLGKVCRGVPTAHSAPPLASKIRSKDKEAYVLACPEGEVRGQSLSPIYKTAAQAALKDTAFHEILALVDAIRIGRARERKLAQELLEKMVMGKDSD